MVLRFFQGRDLKEVGAALGMGEDAARMRINRALEKLRKFFVKRGVALSAAAIAGAVSANSVHAAPAVLSKSVTAVAVAKGSAATVSTLTLVKGALKIMAWTKAKTAIIAGAALLLAAGTTAVVVHRFSDQFPSPRPIPTGQTEFPKASWHFAGYGNPESAFESCIWAVNNGDVKTLVASVGPSMQKKFANMPAANIITDKDRADFGMMTGFRILNREDVSENEVTFEVYSEGLEQTQKFSMQRVNGQWRFGGKAAAATGQDMN